MRCGQGLDGDWVVNGGLVVECWWGLSEQSEGFGLVKFRLLSGSRKILLQGCWSLLLRDEFCLGIS
jgi:hypothetical protein